MLYKDKTDYWQAFAYFSAPLPEMMVGPAFFEFEDRRNDGKGKQCPKLKEPAKGLARRLLSLG